MLSRGDRRGRCSGSGEGRWFVVMGDLERCNSSMVGGLWCTFSTDGLGVLWTQLSVEQREGQSETLMDGQGRDLTAVLKVATVEHMSLQEHLSSRTQALFHRFKKIKVHILEILFLPMDKQKMSTDIPLITC